MARVGVLLNEPGAAVDALDALNQAMLDGLFSVPLLKIDPFWDSLRKNPRFQALLKEKPAHTPSPSATSAE